MEPHGVVMLIALFFLLDGLVPKAKQLASAFLPVSARSGTVMGLLGQTCV